MVTVGVTGGIGSGKTSFCRFLESWGARVFYADDVARRLMETDATIIREVTKAFGKEAYGADGALNRAFLAAQVFGHADRLAVLNGIVHPRVYRAFDAFVRDATMAQAPLVVRESALLPRGAARAGLDLLVVIRAPEASRIDRVTRRDQVPAEDIRKRMQHQLSQDEFAALADRVIDNSGTLDDLQSEARALYTELVGTDPIH